MIMIFGENGKRKKHPNWYCLFECESEKIEKYLQNEKTARRKLTQAKKFSFFDSLKIKFSIEKKIIIFSAGMNFSLNDKCCASRLTVMVVVFFSLYQPAGLPFIKLIKIQFDFFFYFTVLKNSTKSVKNSFEMNT